MFETCLQAIKVNNNNKVNGDWDCLAEMDDITCKTRFGRIQEGVNWTLENFSQKFFSNMRNEDSLKNY